MCLSQGDSINRISGVWPTEICQSFLSRTCRFEVVLVQIKLIYTMQRLQIYLLYSRHVKTVVSLYLYYAIGHKPKCD